jgi:hypothetical protein
VLLQGVEPRFIVCLACSLVPMPTIISRLRCENLQYLNQADDSSMGPNTTHEMRWKFQVGSLANRGSLYSYVNTAAAKPNYKV